jgi:acyl-coenzyme A thioesterase PaaI-like protein
LISEESLLADGWQRLPTVRYSAAIGPTFARRVDGVLTVGLLAQDHLSNDNLGIVHGGAMMTFADMAMGCGVGFDDTSMQFVTAQLQVHFVAAAPVNSFIACNPEVVRRTSSLVFMRGLIEAEGRTVASVDGMFKLLDAAKFASMNAITG